MTSGVFDAGDDAQRGATHATAFDVDVEDALEAMHPAHDDRDTAATVPDRRGAKNTHAFPKPLYRLRNRIQRCLNKLKPLRRIATRYEKLAANFLARDQACNRPYPVEGL